MTVPSPSAHDPLFSYAAVDLLFYAVSRELSRKEAKRVVARLAREADRCAPPPDGFTRLNDRRDPQAAAERRRYGLEMRALSNSLARWMEAA